MKHPSYWHSEFPDFPEITPEVAAMRHAGLLADISWHNDACPSFARVADYAVIDREGSADSIPVLWVNHPDASKRELEEGSRFFVQCVKTEFFHATDDEAEALRVLLAHP